MTQENKITNYELTEDNESCCGNTSCCPPQSPVKRATPKVGRNDPCPCGSERKFKKCCGRSI